MKLTEIEELAKHVFAYTVPDTQVHEVVGITLKLCELVRVQSDYLEKLADPRKRDHRERDKYTEVGCMINIAQEAIDKAKQIGIEVE